MKYTIKCTILLEDDTYIWIRYMSMFINIKRVAWIDIEWVKLWSWRWIVICWRIIEKIDNLILDPAFSFLAYKKIILLSKRSVYFYRFDTSLFLKNYVYIILGVYISPKKINTPLPLAKYTPLHYSLHSHELNNCICWEKNISNECRGVYFPEIPKFSPNFSKSHLKIIEILPKKNSLKLPKNLKKTLPKP